MNSKKYIGNKAEDYVAKTLEKRGFKVIARNYSIHNLGELDIVLEKDSDIYVVEVKTRNINSSIETPYEAINKAKIRKLVNTTKVFIRQRELTDRNVHLVAGLVWHLDNGFIQNIELVPIL